MNKFYMQVPWLKLLK